MFKKIILITLSFLLGGALFYFLTFKVSESVLIPLGMVGILIIPITYCSQAISKTNELKENTTLSDSELPRLDYTVDRRVKRLFLWLVFYVFSATMLIIMNYLSSSDIKYVKTGVLITGGCFGLSLLSVILIHKTIIEVSNFKAQLVQRDAKKKRKQDMLKDLSKE
ncbi:hypothetical protein [Serratia sp. Ag1]|uniref:hypothetical protein n=1 Tax=Serratia sp. Ag1 TaxID=1524467 RepID=UPI0005006A7D|nr:hypothetical protein [Serratia sp. Ag1]KFK98140.1 hypothetical protein IV04_14710 [Serratia sp. Ag1]